MLLKVVLFADSPGIETPLQIAPYAKESTDPDVRS